MSVLLRPRLLPADAHLVTTAMGVAAAEACAEVTGVQRGAQVAERPRGLELLAGGNRARAACGLRADRKLAGFWPSRPSTEAAGRRSWSAWGSTDLGRAPRPRAVRHRGGPRRAHRSPGRARVGPGGRPRSLRALVRQVWPTASRPMRRSRWRAVAEPVARVAARPTVVGPTCGRGPFEGLVERSTCHRSGRRPVGTDALDERQGTDFGRRQDVRPDSGGAPAIASRPPAGAPATTSTRRSRRSSTTSAIVTVVRRPVIHSGHRCRLFARWPRRTDGVRRERSAGWKPRRDRTRQLVGDGAAARDVNGPEVTGRGRPSIEWIACTSRVDDVRKASSTSTSRSIGTSTCATSSPSSSQTSSLVMPARQPDESGGVTRRPSRATKMFVPVPSQSAPTVLGKIASLAPCSWA